MLSFLHVFIFSFSALMLSFFLSPVYHAIIFYVSFLWHHFHVIISILSFLVTFFSSSLSCYYYCVIIFYVIIYVIIFCYHFLLSFTPFFIFPENVTHSKSISYFCYFIHICVSLHIKLFLLYYKPRREQNFSPWTFYQDSLKITMNMSSFSKLQIK